MSISEIAASIKWSYAAVRKCLITSGVTFRSKEEAAHVYIDRHPEWSRQFIKYHVNKKAEITDDKIVLLTMVITEGYVDRTSAGFTNTQDLLHAEFEKLLTKIYGTVRVSRGGMLSRVSSTEIADDLRRMMPGKAFNEAIFEHILKSTQVTAKVLRTIADTEGSMIVSIRKAPRNYTVESRVVLASTNRGFSDQISALLTTLRIYSRSSADGVIINRKDDIERFIRKVGFSPGIRVVRKRAGVSTWYGKEKYILSKLALRVYSEQVKARKSGAKGCFVNCMTRGDVMSKLTDWYEEINGGER
jgi:hypothetical protein